MRILLCLLLSGCALSPEARVEESAFQVLNTLDATQTVLGPGTHPQCFAEHGEFQINGEHPSKAAIIEYSAALGLVHLGVSYLLRDHPWPERIWQMVNLGTSANAVISNRQDGHWFVPQDYSCR